MHRRPVRDFEELTDNPDWAEQIRHIYDNDIERVDLMVGLYAVMASRRLNSDRFFTTDFNAATYTKEGMDWIADNGMASVLLRHFPALAPTLFNVKNPFAPWNLAVQPRADNAHQQNARVAPVADAYPTIPLNRSAPEALLLTGALLWGPQGWRSQRDEGEDHDVLGEVHHPGPARPARLDHAPGQYEAEDRGAGHAEKA
jgi:hypothetical protein